MKPYVYILIRKDLPNAQRVVQSSHVAWEVSKCSSLETHPSMVLIGIDNLTKLSNQAEFLESKGLKVFKFHEPLFGNELTAIAALVTTEADRSVFKKYQLLTDVSFYPEADQKRLALNNCTHSKTKATYQETMAFEYTPKKVCTRCHKTVNETVSEQEKISLLKEFYQDLELEINDKDVDIKKNGFNL